MELLDQSLEWCVCLLVSAGRTAEVSRARLLYLTDSLSVESRYHSTTQYRDDSLRLASLNFLQNVTFLNRFLKMFQRKLITNILQIFNYF